MVQRWEWEAKAATTTRVTKRAVYGGHTHGSPQFLVLSESCDKPVPTRQACFFDLDVVYNRHLKGIIKPSPWR